MPKVKISLGSYLLSDKNRAFLAVMCMHVFALFFVWKEHLWNKQRKGNLIRNRWIGTHLGFGTAVQNIQAFLQGQATYMVSAFFFLLSFHVCQFSAWDWERTVNSTVLLLYWKHTSPRQQMRFDSFHWWTSADTFLFLPLVNIICHQAPFTDWDGR